MEYQNLFGLVGVLLVSVVVHRWVEEGKSGMVVDKVVGDNKGFLHMLADIDVCHTLVVFGVDNKNRT